MADLSKLVNSGKGVVWISPAIIKLLQMRIRNEDASGRIYQSMSNWAKFKGYIGTAALMALYSREEYAHAHIFRDYLQAYNVLPIEDALPMPKAEFASMIDVFKQGLAHELVISEEINELTKEAFKVGDMQAFRLGMQFSSEQHEEVEKFTDAINRIELCREDPSALLLIDKEFGEMANS